MSATPSRVFASKWGPCQTAAHTEHFADENSDPRKVGGVQISGKKIDLELIDIIEHRYKVYGSLCFSPYFMYDFNFSN